MNGRAQIQTRLARACDPQSSGLFFAPIHDEELRSLIFAPSPKLRSFAWQGAENDADHLKAWLPHALLLQPQAWQTTANGSIAARSQRHPFWRCPSTESFHRAPILPYFPCSPSVTVPVWEGRSPRL